MKNIWIFNHYATKPDEPATREYDISRELVNRGHKVTIFASSFSHYKLKEKYLLADEKWKAESYNGVNFFWIKTFSYKKNNWRRAVNMLSYAWNTFWISRKIKERPDVVIGTCVHPFAVLSAYFTSKQKKSRFFFEVTEPWPQTLIDLGLLSRWHPTVFILRTLEKFFYRKAEKVITLFPFTEDYIEENKLPKEKIVVIPNGLDLSRYANIKPYNGGSPERFNVMFLGGHSRYAGLEVILETARLLQKENRNNIRFIFVGDGLEKPDLVKRASKLNLQNVEFRGMVPKDEVFRVMEEADAFICIIKNIPDWIDAISSNKLNDYLASGRPIIFTANPRKNPVEEAKAGITIPPENPEVLMEAINKLISLAPEERIKMGKRGLDYVKKNYDIKKLSQRLESLL